MSQINNQKIARNTLMLYGRTAFTLLISLITSRVTLHALGVENYGIISAVGGIIALFEIVTGSLSNSISRFITFELGHGDQNRLSRIFSTSMNIQIGIGIFILIIAEPIGIWFLNSQMNIPEGRMVAANWVLQCTFVSFFISLTQTPYSASIIGHEKMSVYAYFSVIGAILRLGIVYLLYVSPYDKLITISILGLIVSVSLRFAQRIYCKRNFSECHYTLLFDKDLMKEMTGFASWGVLTNGVWIVNNQGVNILINVFFGVTFNAARGLALSLEGVIMKFVNDFMMAMNPQITKSYAAGEINEMNRLICRGTRFAYYLMLVMSLPLLFEAYEVLYLWLGMVPEHTVTFFRLSIIGTMVVLLGQTGVTASMATGRIKWYTIIISLISAFMLPITYLTYELGGPVEMSYYMFIATYAICDVVRLFIMKKLWGFPISMYIKETIIPICLVTSISIIIPCLLNILLQEGIQKTIAVFVCAPISVITTVYLIGLKRAEREGLHKKIATIKTNRFARL